MAIPLTYGLFFLGIAFHIAGAGAALRYLGGKENFGWLRAAERMTSLSAGLLLLALLLRFATWGIAPLSTGADVLCIFILMVLVISSVVALREERRALLLFYLPPLAGIGLICAFLALKDFREPPLDTIFSQLFLVVHVLLAFLAYALFFVASLTSVAYAFQARHLKKRATTGLFQKLPSLENLDRTLFRLITAGYPLFVLTLVLGLVYAWRDPSPLSPTWWWSPKILLSIAMVLFYAVSFHGRALGLLRGPKLAHFVFIGFTLLLTVYLVLVILRVMNYNFYGTA